MLDKVISSSLTGQLWYYLYVKKLDRNAKLKVARLHIRPESARLLYQGHSHTHAHIVVVVVVVVVVIVVSHCSHPHCTKFT